MYKLALPLNGMILDRPVLQNIRTLCVCVFRLWCYRETWIWTCWW